MANLQKSAVSVVQKICKIHNYNQQLALPDPTYITNDLNQPIFKATAKFFVNQGKFIFTTDNNVNVMINMSIILTYLS